MHADRLAPPSPTPPAARGPHLLDAAAFWGPVGGVRRVLETRQARLIELGWRHTLMAPGVQGQGRIDCGGWTLPASGGQRLPLGCGRVQRLIEQAEPDLIEAADPYTLAWSVLGAARRLRVPAVASCHSDLPLLAARLAGGPQGLGTARGRWAARRARDYLTTLYARFDLVLAPSQALANRLRAWGVKHVRVQPLGVDCRIFKPAPVTDLAARQQLCQQLGLSPATRLLVYSGRFAPEKNLSVLADAVRLLGPDHALLAVGGGPSPPQGDSVRVLPAFTDDRRLARLLGMADAYVHAGDQETFGLGVLEAMACGTPVVVSDCGGSGELADQVGTLVQRCRPHEWAEAISASLAAGRGPTTGAALARARAHDWQPVTALLSQRYQGLLQRHVGRPVGWPQPPRLAVPSPGAPSRGLPW